MSARSRVRAGSRQLLDRELLAAHEAHFAKRSIVGTAVPATHRLFGTAGQIRPLWPDTRSQVGIVRFLRLSILDAPLAPEIIRCLPQKRCKTRILARLIDRVQSIESLGYAFRCLLARYTRKPVESSSPSLRRQTSPTVPSTTPVQARRS